MIVGTSPLLFTWSVYLYVQLQNNMVRVKAAAVGVKLSVSHRALSCLMNEAACSGSSANQ